MSSQCLIIIRHAEKPIEGESGVGEDGVPDALQLTVRGWQRAGGLAQRFAEQRDGMPCPERVIAPASTSVHPSLRGLSTALPLARRLGLQVDTSFEVRQESRLANRLASLDGCTLVVWQHAGLPKLIRALLPANTPLPERWPEARFDVIWLLKRPSAATSWSFEQQPQGLLGGDVSDPIAV